MLALWLIWSCKYGIKSIKEFNFPFIITACLFLFWAFTLKLKIMTETLFKKLLETKPMQGIVLNIPELKDKTFIPNNYKLFTIWSLN